MSGMLPKSDANRPLVAEPVSVEVAVALDAVSVLEISPSSLPRSAFA